MTRCGRIRSHNIASGFRSWRAPNYLISNSLGAVPASTAASLQAYFEAWATRGVRAWEDSWWSLVSDLGDLVAPLIGARNGEVVFQPNVTLTHAVVFSAVRFSGARNKIVTDGMHFPSILYLIDEQRKYGAEVDVVPSHDGITVETQKLIDRIDERTAIVNVSHVLFKSAYIHDVAAITARARRVGALTVIDGYQAVGTIPVDVRALGSRRLHRRLPEVALRRARGRVPVGGPRCSRSARAGTHGVDGPRASLFL